MAGFLDRNTRIIDMVLTNYGKSLLSKGELNFCYWTPFDDEVDYDPYIATSGSMTEDQLSDALHQSIETAPVREATTGYRQFNVSGSDFTNVHRPMFTAPQGQVVLPRAVISSSGDTNLVTYQRRVTRIYQGRDKNGKYVNSLEPINLGIERFDSKGFTLDLFYKKDSFPADFQPEGFHVVVLRSGSSGWTEVEPRRDMSNDISYMNDVRIFTGMKGGG